MNEFKTCKTLQLIQFLYMEIKNDEKLKNFYEFYLIVKDFKTISKDSKELFKGQPVYSTGNMVMPKGAKARWNWGGIHFYIKENKKQEDAYVLKMFDNHIRKYPIGFVPTESKWLTGK